MSAAENNSDGAGSDDLALSDSDLFSRRDDPLFHLTLWPNRSMPRHGFHKVLLFTAGMLALPLIPLLGTPVGWALLPFLLGTLFLLWFFIQWNYRDGKTREELSLWKDAITVQRFDPQGREKRWSANPYWVTLALYEDGKIENYLTISGNGREIELGSFLSPEERSDLKEELERELLKVKRA